MRGALRRLAQRLDFRTIQVWPKETGRWFAGRFIRQALLTRDGRALLVSSTAGVVRIEL